MGLISFCFVLALFYTPPKELSINHITAHHPGEGWPGYQHYNIARSGRWSVLLVAAACLTKDILH